MTAGKFCIATIAALCLCVGPVLRTSVMASEPTIACPPGPIDVSASKMSQVTIDLPVQGADSVYMPAGTWKNGRFTFVASRPGPWALTVFAFSGRERTSCVLRINVRFDDAPASNFAVESPQVPCPNPPDEQIQCDNSGSLNATVCKHE